MKTSKQIKQLVENIASVLRNIPTGNKGVSKKETNVIREEFAELTSTIRDKYLPLFQFNIDTTSPTEAQAVFEKISENVKGRTYAAYLPDGQHTIDNIGRLEMETPTILEWQNSESGQNFVINYTENTKEQGIGILNQLVVDMLLSLPSRSINLHFIDLAFSGQAAFLTKNLDSRLYGKLIVEPDDWRKLQSNLRDKMTKALQEYGDVVRYNDEKNRVVVPYDVVVISGYKKSLSQMREAAPLFESGHKGGIYFILMNETDYQADKSTIDSLMAMTNAYQTLDAENYGRYSKDAFIRCTPILDNPILAQACFNYINEGAEVQEETVVAASIDYNKMLSGFERIEEEGIIVPVGSTEDGNLVDFTFNTVDHIHAFIIGQSGTGKSVFLHDIIIGAMAKYAPDELELYLMDFKMGGVEFNRYKDEKHVKALLVDNSDIQITLEILRDISNKMRERGKMLRSSGVSNIVEYNNVNPTKRMPRIVVIADECHVMFPTANSREAKLYREITEILAKITKEGRSQGVHLILATQTIAQADISSEIKNNISDAYLLKCAPGDAQRLAGDKTPEVTSQLKTGQVLHHSIDTDFVFKSSYLPTKEALEVISKINAKTKAYKNEQFYFVGSQLFTLDDGVKSLLTQQGRATAAMALGRSIDTKMEPVVIPLRDEKADNVLLFGVNDEEQVSRTTLASLLSLRAANKTIKISVINCLSPEQENTNKTLNELAGKGEIELLEPRDSGKVLYDMAVSIKNENAEPTALYIFGQERFRELRDDMEIKVEENKPQASSYDFGSSLSFGSASAVSPSNTAAVFNSYQKALNYILENGAEAGVHVVLQIDKPQNLLFSDYVVGKTLFKMFSHLVMLHSDNNALNNLNLSDDLWLTNLSRDVERLRAIYYNGVSQRYTLFTPFA